jgi:hypothetical protein
MRKDQITLKGSRILGFDLEAGELSKTGIDAIHRLITLRCCINSFCSGLNSCATGWVKPDT